MISGAKPGPASPDGDLPTLHLRCGSDIRDKLLAAGFTGEFLEHSYPYFGGPVRDDGEGVLEQRARHIAESLAGEPGFTYEAVLAALDDGERQLAASVRSDRVVIWSEGDAWDQLVLLRLLHHYSVHGRPGRLELVNVGAYPGFPRFLGLGQLSPDDLRGLWVTRAPATDAQLALGREAWRALASQDPRALAVIARSGTPALPLLAPALRRHLSELPWVGDGLSCTERLALQVLAAAPCTLDALFRRLTDELDPLPGQGDLQVRDRVLALEAGRRAVITRVPGNPRAGRLRPPWTDLLSITEHGSSLLAGTADLRALALPPRWVGGVRVAADAPDWRWDPRSQDCWLVPQRNPP